MELDELYLDFVRGAARAMWVDAWAAHEEELGHRLQGDLMKAAPPTPSHALFEGARLLGMLEQVNGLNVYYIVTRATDADGKPVDVEEFGHYVALQSLGHGVSWFDDHAKFALRIPSFEFRLAVE